MQKEDAKWTFRISSKKRLLIYIVDYMQRHNPTIEVRAFLETLEAEIS